MMKVKQGSIGGVDSTQHMLHCMSQYNNRTLGTKGGAHVARVRTSSWSSTEWGRGVNNKGEGESWRGWAKAARPESRLTKGNNR
jgi:hypothetical protein